MIGIIVKALLGNTWHTGPLISSMLHVKRGKKVFRQTGPILYYIQHIMEAIRRIAIASIFVRPNYTCEQLLECLKGMIVSCWNGQRGKKLENEGTTANFST